MADYLSIASGLWLKYLSQFADILLTAVIIYYILTLLKGTRAIAIFKGILILIFLTVVSKLLKLTTLSWLLSGAWVVGMVAIVIVFQPELRFLLAKLGSGKVAGFLFRIKPDWINAIIETMETAQKKGWGALIVIQLNMGMKNYTETGIKIDGDVSSELLLSIFNPSSPLHDGAVVLKGNRILAASCIMPLTMEEIASRILGTRHRAAIGISDVSDAWAVVLSEETSSISLARGGKLMRNISPEELRKELVDLYRVKEFESAK
ncbi:diadenylate cyclase CdaA [bacterium]|nr:TIGR00159 family protein [bacterium]MBU4134592.1 diadenylate cyclase CdaA [bacterium]